jgi:hypothetical protein
MTRRRLVPAIALLTVFVVSGRVEAFPQSKPNFTGKWAIDNAAAPADADGRSRPAGPFGAVMTITQTEKALTIEHTQNGRPTTTTFMLDGTSSHAQLSGRDNQPFDQVTTAEWQGSSLVVTIKTQMGDMKRIFSADGPRLKLEVRPPESLGPRAAPFTVLYKKDS